MQAWTLEYRPKTIKELHHKVVRDQLLEFLKKGKIPQVLLFAGPKGIGKTSASRIIAAVLNDKKNTQAVKLAYSQDNSTLLPLQEPDVSDPFIVKILSGKSYVVQELDAASNRGINEIRDLKERVLLPPIEGNISVFILDEAHMLTTPAFNALLKIMEEPPSHAIFILATTEIDKIPETVLSRCQVLRFSKASNDEIRQLLEQIIKKEKITLRPDVLNKILELADGSFRDAVKLLEQVTTHNQTSNANAALAFFPPIIQEIEKLVNYIIKKDAQEVSQIFKHLREIKIDENYFSTKLLGFLHHQLMLNIFQSQEKPKIDQSVALFLLKSFNQPLNNQNNYIPLLATEIIALELIERAKKKNGNPPKIPKSTSFNQSKTQEKQVAGDGQKLIDQWGEFVNKVGNINAKLATLFCTTKPFLAEKNKVIMGVFYKFHQEQLTQPQVINLIQTIASDIGGGFIEFEFQLEEQQKHSLDLNQALIS